MGDLRDWGELHTVEVLFGRRQVPLAIYYLALLETPAAEGVTGAQLDEPESNEYSTYARLAMANDAVTFSPGPGAYNLTRLIFPTLASADIGCTIVGVALCTTAATATGNVVSSKTHAPIGLVAGVAPYYEAGSLTFGAD